jgi:23S rRNA (guanine745-N1)-methyltransferase
MLACPHCGETLRETAGSLRCPRSHTFDLARQGYVNLLTESAPNEGDSAEMVAARAAVLERGHLGPLRDAIADEAVDKLAAGTGGILDVGGGTGHHLSAVLDRSEERAGLVLDLSTYAARRAARAHTRAGAAVCDVWSRLPVRDDAAALVLSAFAPRNGSEFARVLAPGGSAVVAWPTERHLLELVRPVGTVSVDERKRELVDSAMAPLKRAGCREVEFVIHVSRDEAIDLVAMGPTAHHLSREEIGRRLEGAEADSVTVSVEVAVFRPSSQSAQD